MSTETLSLDLYKANVELQLRITRLLQETGHQWLEAVRRASTDNIAETGAEIESLLRTASWQSLGTLPANLSGACSSSAREMCNWSTRSP